MPARGQVEPRRRIEPHPALAEASASWTRQAVDVTILGRVSERTTRVPGGRASASAPRAEAPASPESGPVILSD